MTSAFNCSSTSTEFCYNTAIDAKQIVFGLAINLIIGLACYAGFVLWRGSFRIYSNRLTTPQLAPWQRPPALKLGGHWQLWSWLIPVFTVSDRALLESAGLDALVALRVLGCGCLAFMPLTLLGVGVLIPVTYTGYVVPANHVESNSTTEVFNDAFLRMSGEGAGTAAACAAWAWKGRGQCGSAGRRYMPQGGRHAEQMQP